MKNKVLIIGGSGFLGSHVADELIKKNFKVTIIDINHPKNMDKKKKFVKVNNRDISLISKEIKKSNIIYYFADIADIRFAKDNYMKTINNNILNLTKILDSCKKSKIDNFIYASSLYVYSEAGSFYRASKQCAEILVKEFSRIGNFNYKFLRFGSLYGENAQSWNGISQFIDQINKKGFIQYKGNGKEIRDYIHVKDAAKLSVKILERKIDEKAISIFGQKSISVDQLFDLMFEISGKRKKVKYLNKINADDHYGYSPYRFIPENSIKLSSDTSIDLGEGLLRLFNNNEKK